MKKAYSFAHFERFCRRVHDNGERHIGQMYQRYVTVYPAFEEDLARDMIGNKTKFAAMLERLNDRVAPPAMEAHDHHRDPMREEPPSWVARFERDEREADHDSGFGRGSNRL